MHYYLNEEKEVFLPRRDSKEFHKINYMVVKCSFKEIHS